MARVPVSEFLQRPCPHCGKRIPTLPPCPRDWGLYLNCMTYRVPIDAEITPEWVEIVRVHCRMKPERLKELRDPKGHHARHWERMLLRRAARLEVYQKTGEIPPSWRGLMPGEQDHLIQLQGHHEYRHTLARVKAKLRNRPEAVEAKMRRKVLDMERVKSRAAREERLNDITATLAVEMGAAAGTISLSAYKMLEASMLDKGTARRRRKASAAPPPDKGIHSAAGEPAPMQGEAPALVQRSVETP